MNLYIFAEKHININIKLFIFTFTFMKINNANENNLFFLLNECNQETCIDNDTHLNEIMCEFKNATCTNDVVENDLFRELSHYYSEKYNVTQLLKICDYYDLTKYVKMAKYKKKEIVDSIVLFEMDPVNTMIVCKRQKLWHYIEELGNDKYMKKYIIWS